MKKGLVVLALVFSSQSVFADFQKGDILKEVWTCKGKSDSVVDSVTVTVDRVKNTAVGGIYDGTMTGSEIALKKMSDLYKLGGYVAPGHDNREYSVQLIQSRKDDFDWGFETKLNGQAVVVYEGFIDCIGDIGGAEVLSCDVELERQ